MGGIAVEVDHDMGIGVVGEELKSEGVRHGLGWLEAEIVLTDELLLVLVVEVER